MEVKTVRDILDAPVPIGGLPLQFYSIDQVMVWHVRRVVRDSATWQEAASRLGRSEMWLRDFVRRCSIAEKPFAPGRFNIDRHRPGVSYDQATRNDVLDLMANGDLTRKEISARTGVSVATQRRWELEDA